MSMDVYSSVLLLTRTAPFWRETGLRTYQTGTWNSEPTAPGCIHIPTQHALSVQGDFKILVVVAFFLSVVCCFTSFLSLTQLLFFKAVGVAGALYPYHCPARWGSSGARKNQHFVTTVVLFIWFSLWKKHGKKQGAVKKNENEKNYLFEPI